MLSKIAYHIDLILSIVVRLGKGEWYCETCMEDYDGNPNDNLHFLRVFRI